MQKNNLKTFLTENVLKNETVVYTITGMLFAFLVIGAIFKTPTLIIADMVLTIIFLLLYISIHKSALGIVSDIVSEHSNAVRDKIFNNSQWNANYWKKK